LYTGFPSPSNVTEFLLTKQNTFKKQYKDVSPSFTTLGNNEGEGEEKP
jgi:hypothetical protein